MYGLRTALIFDLPPHSNYLS